MTNNERIHQLSLYLDDETEKELLKPIEKDLEVLDIIKRAPFILERLFDNFELTKEAENRYFYGTITDAEVKKVEEWINDVSEN